MGFKLGKNKVRKVTEHKYFPENKSELKDILEKRLKEDKDVDLNDIDVSNIKDMSYLFYSLDPHNIDISEWDVSKVVDMERMFSYCTNFNSDLSNWDVSSVTNMKHMFYFCVSFEGKGLENWDVSNVEDMTYMFNQCHIVYDLKNIPSWYKE